MWYIASDSLCLISRPVHWAPPGTSLRWMNHVDLKLIWTAAIHHKLCSSCEIAFLFFFYFSMKQEKLNRPSNAIAYYIHQTLGIKNVCPLTFSFSEIFPFQKWLQCAWHEYVPQETLWAMLFFVTDNVKNGRVLNPLQVTI